MKVRYKVYGISETNDGKSVRLQLKSISDIGRPEYADINITLEEAKSIRIGAMFELSYVMEGVVDLVAK